MLEVSKLARAEKSRAAKMRVALAKDGYRLTKCRRGYGGYAVIDCERNFAVFGLSDDGRGYDASLDEVEAWASV